MIRHQVSIRLLASLVTYSTNRRWDAYSTNRGALIAYSTNRGALIG